MVVPVQGRYSFNMLIHDRIARCQNGLLFKPVIKGTVRP
jgi:hypothetical protein